MKIVLTGNYGAENMGDEMILKGLLTTLTHISPSLEITILSGNPEQTKLLHKVESEKKFPSGPRSLISAIFDRKSQTRKAVKNCDYFILGGGGLFGGPNKKANIIWGIQALMAYLYKKPVIIYGQSVGEIRTNFEKWIIKKVFSQATLIVVRDAKSAERLKTLGINKEIHIVPDMAFALENPEIKEPRKNIMVVALRQIEGLTRDFKVSIAEFIDWLTVNKRYEVKIVNFQEGDASDDILHKSILKLSEYKEHIEYLPKITDQKLLEIFQEAKLVLGMRFHSIIYSIKTKTPFISISYAPKVQDLLADIGLDSYMLTPEKVSLNSLQQKLEEVMKNQEKIISIEEKYTKDSYEKHKQMEKILAKILL